MTQPGEEFLERLVRKGTLTVIRADGSRRTFGDGSEDEIVVRFHDARAQRDLARNPVMAMGELYAAGRYSVEAGDIFDLLSLLKRNGSAKALPPKLVARATVSLLAGLAKDALTGDRTRADVAHHYDLDGGLFDLFLDRNKQYSCAYFPDGDEDLDAAQRKKMRHIAAKLMIEPGQSVLDIGCGWGGMAIYLAQVCGARVTGVTLSEKQAREASERVAAAGVADRVTIELKDYRGVAESFDRIVSVGMFEHVGLKNYATFFRALCDRLVRVGGIAVLHSIGDTKPGRRNNPWMEKYIFPGTYVPAVSEVAPHAERAGLLIKDVEIWPIHYANTLRAWRMRFMARRAQAEALYDAHFARMWEFYLAGMETSFRHDRLFVFQMQLARHQDAVPFHRDYIPAEEERLANVEKTAGLF